MRLHVFFAPRSAEVVRVLKYLSRVLRNQRNDPQLLRQMRREVGREGDCAGKGTSSTAIQAKNISLVVTVCLCSNIDLYNIPRLSMAREYNRELLSSRRTIVRLSSTLPRFELPFFNRNFTKSFPCPRLKLFGGERSIRRCIEIRAEAKYNRQLAPLSKSIHQTSHYILQRPVYESDLKACSTYLDDTSKTQLCRVSLEAFVGAKPQSTRSRPCQSQPS